MLQVFTRRDQLRLRSQKKESGGRGRGRGRGKGRARSKRNLQKLKSRSRSDVEEEKSSGRRRSKSSKSDSKSKPGKLPPKEKASPSQRKPDKSDQQSKKAKKEKFVVQPVPLSDNENEGGQIPAWFKNEQAELDYWCGQIDWMLDPESFKKEIRKNLAKDTLARPNIYWKTFNCGVTMKYYEEGEWKKQDVAHFSFAKNQVGLLVAIACAEHLVLRLQPDQPFCGRFIMVYQLPL